MTLRLNLVLILFFLLAACSADGPERVPAQRACDDGGAGGVLIDGVCL